MSTQLFPDVIDASTLQPRLTSAIFLPIGIEGQADAAGTATVGTLYSVTRVDEAVTLFGPLATNALARLVKAILDRGAGPVIAVASKKGSAPLLTERQVEWEKLETDEKVRIRLTDTVVQAEIAALAVSCKNADTVFNKQFCMVGMPTGTSKATYITAADAVAADVAAAKRAVLLAPGVYDEAGTLRDGAYAAATVAAEVSKNADPSMDQDLWDIPYLTAIEKDSFGLSLFRKRVAAGVGVNDFEDLLLQGVSPLMPTRIPGGVRTTHLRTCYHVDGTFDSLQTRIVVDQVFLDVKNYIIDGNFLRLGNTDEIRARIKSGVEALLAERGSWIRPVTQADGTLGYNVAVTSSADNRQVTISYEGTVVRGISTVKVAANLTIPV